MPSEPNFMCTGLETLAPFFGSMKKTRGFLAFVAAPAAFLVVCAPAATPNAAIAATTSRPSCFLRIIRLSFRRDILSLKPSSEARFAQTPRCGLECQDAIGDGASEPLVGGCRQDGSAAARGDGADRPPGFVRVRVGQAGARVLEQ